MTDAELPARRSLGNSGISVRPLCFGGNVFGWTIDEKRSFELLDAFVDDAELIARIKAQSPR